jgi:hypothetical protein
MKKVLVALSAAAALGLATMAAPTTAEARCIGCAVGAGVVGGLLLGGAIANSAAAAPPAYYAPAPGYAPYPAYAQPYPVACPGGYWARRPVYDRWGNVIGYSGRARFVCP